MKRHARRRTASPRAWDVVFGMNARNTVIGRVNSQSSIRLVKDKMATKEALIGVGAAVSPTLAYLEDRSELTKFSWDQLPPAWALKPNRGGQGKGILLSVGHQTTGTDMAPGWLSPSGKPIGRVDAQRHLRSVLDGDFSNRDGDGALFEPLLKPHPGFADLVPVGLPDVRVICWDDLPLMAMTRLPTLASNGKANLHQGAIGAALDLDTGRITHALLARRPIERHPDTGAVLVGAQLPEWDGILDAARRCGQATGLQYVGADLVVDGELGALILEVNARPGLEIQNVNRAGLRDRVGV